MAENSECRTSEEMRFLDIEFVQMSIYQIMFVLSVTLCVDVASIVYLFLFVFVKILS